MLEHILVFPCALIDGYDRIIGRLAVRAVKSHVA